MKRFLAPLIFTAISVLLTCSGHGGTGGVLFKIPAPFSTSTEVTEFKEIFLLSSSTGEILQKDGKRVIFQFPLVQLIIFNDENFFEVVRENSQITLFNKEILDREISLKSFSQCFEDTHVKAIESKLASDKLWIGRIKAAKPYLQPEIDILSKDLNAYKGGERKVNGQWLSLFQYAKQSWLADPMFEDLMTEDQISAIRMKVKSLDEQISANEASRKQFEEVRSFLSQQVERYEKGERRKNGEWFQLKDLEKAESLKQFSKIESEIYEIKDLEAATILVNRAQSVSDSLPAQSTRARAWEQEIYSVKQKLKDFDASIKNAAINKDIEGWLYPSNVDALYTDSKDAKKWVNGLSTTLTEIPPPQIKALAEEISLRKKLVEHFASIRSTKDLITQRNFKKCKDLIENEQKILKEGPENSVTILLLKSLDSHQNVIDLRLAEYQQKLTNAEQLKKMGKTAASIKELEAAFVLYPDPKIPEMIKGIRENSLGL